MTKIPNLSPPFLKGVRGIFWNFEFGSLGFICNLVFGACYFFDFKIFGTQSIFYFYYSDISLL